MGGVNAKAVAAVNRLYPLEVRRLRLLYFLACSSLLSQDGDNATIPNIDPATLVEEEEVRTPEERRGVR